MKQPQPYFHSSHLHISAKVTAYVVESSRLREVEKHREREGERAKHCLASLHLGSAGQQPPEEKGCIISLHLRPWTCHGPKAYSRCPWDPPAPTTAPRPTSLLIEKRGEGQSAERMVAWEAMRTHKKKSYKSLAVKYKLEKFHSHIGGISQCWWQKIKAFNEERHQGQKYFTFECWKTCLVC